MKRIILLILFLSVSGGLIYAQSIKIDHPSGSSNCKIGALCKITWTKLGKMDNMVKIRLFNSTATAKIFNISEGTPNNGSFPWTIPGSVKPGKYIIRVKTLDNKVFDDSPVFAISGTGQTVMVMKQVNPFDMRARMNQKMLQVKPTIGVASPKAGDKLDPTKVCNVTWKGTGLMFSRVHIKALLISKNYLYTVAYNTENDGSYPWNLAKASWTPGDYKIQIATTSGGVLGWSGVFTILPKATAAACNSGDPSKDLECLINNYRQAHGLPPIPHSATLEKVAKAHVKDLATYHPDNQCGGNTHSWSKNGPWTGGCYDSNNSSTYPIMWLKPKEIAGDSAYGFEIAGKGYYTAKDALNGWINSSAHNDVILQKGMWSSYKWKGIAVAMYAGYKVAWFKK